MGDTGLPLGAIHCEYCDQTQSHYELCVPIKARAAAHARFCRSRYSMCTCTQADIPTGDAHVEHQMVEIFVLAHFYDYFKRAIISLRHICDLAQPGSITV